MNAEPVPALNLSLSNSISTSCWRPTASAVFLLLWEVFACIVILILFFICIKMLMKKDMAPKEIGKVEYLKTILRFLVLSLFGSWIVVFTLTLYYNSLNIIYWWPIKELSDTLKEMLKANLDPIVYFSYAFFYGTLLLGFVEIVFAYRKRVLKENAKPMSD